jgi:glutamyl-tRNA synthetase
MSKAALNDWKTTPMTHPIVRFAPSPTGRLHVGNVRTALINWLFAHSKGGKFILRIDDTDLERSTKAYEDGLREDLIWLGLVWADTFSQSARFAEYDKAAARLKDMGLLYACYETADELERKRKIALSRGRPPVYDRASLDLTDAEKVKLEADGVKPHWRFKLSGNRVDWDDLVRGPQSIDTSSLSDPVLIREDGSYLYTMPSVVDDIEANITHVVRGEDHVTNSGAQIEIFMALGGKAPQMAHTPLLIGADGQGLSKRLGSLSMGELREQGYEPMAITSLLAKIGTSDNVEARTSLDELSKEFNFGKIGRAPARFDEADLLSLNAHILHGLPFDDVKDRLAAVDPRAAELLADTGREGVGGCRVRRCGAVGGCRGPGFRAGSGGPAAGGRPDRRDLGRMDQCRKGRDGPKGQGPVHDPAQGADGPGTRAGHGEHPAADRA